MKPFLRQTLDRQLLRLHELDALLSASDVVSDLDRFRALTREHAEASVIAEQYTRLTTREADLAGAESMLAEAKDDPEMAAMAEEEIAAAKVDIAQIDEALQLMLIPKDPDDVRPAFVEIRAGTGGDESALFAGDLCRMYTRFAEREPTNPLPGSTMSQRTIIAWSSWTTLWQCMTYLPRKSLKRMYTLISSPGSSVATSRRRPPMNVFTCGRRSVLGSRFSVNT